MKFVTIIRRIIVDELLPTSHGEKRNLLTLSALLANLAGVMCVVTISAIVGYLSILATYGVHIHIRDIILQCSRG